MGRDKCLLEVDGQPLWKRQFDLLMPLSSDIWVVAPTRPDWCDDSMQWARDVTNDRGPLAGLAAALEISSAPLVVVLAVDLPSMRTDYLCSLAKQATVGCGIVPAMDGLFQPLAAIYPKVVLPEALIHLEHPDRSFQALLRELVAQRKMRSLAVSPDDRFLFRNLNSPGD
jgi:molybdenum cofactor guanylyltransferase